jgi:S-adenosylmethionine hydrolase
VTLWQAVPYFPPGTIFLAVVDPGVGTRRRPILVETNTGQPENGSIFIGPDNGLFSFVQAGSSRTWELANPAFRLPRPSLTFHGRDIFAPAAAYAARGARGPEFGPPVLDPVRLPAPRLEQVGPGLLAGEILFPDRFGNYLTSLGLFEPVEGETLRFVPWTGSAILPDSGKATSWQFAKGEAALILPGGKQLALLDTYAQIPVSQTAALVGSSGLLEIAANRERAVGILNLAEGAPVTLKLSFKRNT